MKYIIVKDLQTGNDILINTDMIVMAEEDDGYVFLELIVDSALPIKLDTNIPGFIELLKTSKFLI